MFRLLLIALILASGSLAEEDCGVADWDSEYDEPYTFKCPDDTRQAISSVESCHDNWKEDRIWNYGCSDIPGTLDTFQTSANTPYDEKWEVVCPTNSVMTGHHSVHDNRKEDRTWTFTCGSSSVGEICTVNCTITDEYINEWDEYFKFELPEGKVIVGAKSDHKNSKEDRKWKYTYCDVITC